VRGDRFEFLEFEGLTPRRTVPSEVEAQETAPAVEAVPCRFELLEILGEPGREVGQFQAPQGLCVDAQGNLYVADTYNHRIQKITPAGEVYLLGGPHQMRFPHDVAVDSSYFIYVLDTGHHRVLKYRPDGVPVSTFGRRGRALSYLETPLGIAVDAFHNVYIADTGNRRVQKFSADGRFLQALGGEGSLIPLRKPVDVEVDSGGRIYVADALGHQVVQLSAFGALLKTWGGAGGEAVEAPQAVAVDQHGNLYLAEGGRRVVKFSPDGERLGEFDNVGGPEGPLEEVVSIALAPDGTLYLADSERHCIFHLRQWALY
jgi:sugar lactone lactonase YvrE